MYDLIVVGLGIYGSSVAAYAAEQGLRVAAIDKYLPPHGNGASHGASRIFRLTTVESERYAPLAREAYDIWKQYDEESGGKLLVPKGLAIVSQPDAVDQRHHGTMNIIGSAQDIANKHEIEHQIMNGEEFSALVPALQTSSDDLVYYEPGAFIIRPEVAVAIMIDKCKEYGVELITGAEAHDLRINPDGQSVEIKVGDEVIRGRQAALCTGPWQQAKLLGENAVDAKVKPQVILSISADTTDAMDTDQPAFVYTGADQPLMYSVPPGEGLNEIKIGIEQDEIVIPYPDNFADKESFVASIVAKTKETAKKLLPAIDFSDAKIDVCYYTVTDDSKHRIFAVPHMPRVTVVSACSGHGFKYAPVLARQVVKGLQKNKNETVLKQR